MLYPCATRDGGSTFPLGLCVLACRQVVSNYIPLVLLPSSMRLLILCLGSLHAAAFLTPAPRFPRTTTTPTTTITPAAMRSDGGEAEGAISRKDVISSVFITGNGSSCKLLSMVYHMVMDD